MNLCSHTVNMEKMIKHECLSWELSFYFSGITESDSIISPEGVFEPSKQATVLFIYPPSFTAILTAALQEIVETD